MHCVLAILLKTASLSNDRSSLVITSIYSETPYYGVFLPDVETFFPTPEKNSRIYMTGNKFQGEGTYLRAYCSDILNENAIIQKLRVGLYDSVNDKHTELARVNIGHSSCRRAIDKLWHESKGSQINLSQVVDREECPKGAIVSLAFWGHCSFYGSYSNIFPKAVVKDIHINADVALRIHDEVHDGKFYVGMTTLPGKQFLAWYQGNLHVFLRTRENAWYLLTDTSRRPENGILVSKLAWLTNGPFLPLHQFLADRTSEPAKESRRKRCYKIITCKHESLRSKLSRQMAEIKLEKLEVINSKGDVGSSPRPEYINSWMREIIPPRVQHNDGSSPRSKNSDLWMREIYASPDPSAESSSPQ
ncbi:BgTH12-07586 [Blumeria graminis f. sp. triticale]|uniref:BgtE-5700 n=3 Tax=Blumeria graminis TaxID=34373 RepID=A0A381LC16_BLUGR|nr:putative secreted effector protein [Blumeria graminis f. sp. tritici 96224]CAD6500408.1 BgTH12-07585 [Blumeria graminis f. sp. triticale]CAD6500409.1 BgTH12-07586 [Blumeria graminis f. sp. triticale]VCU40672.1 BgtE-5700 [Blumeria graminis f. sp. tritici]